MRLDYRDHGPKTASLDPHQLCRACARRKHTLEVHDLSFASASADVHVLSSVGVFQELCWRSGVVSNVVDTCYHATPATSQLVID